MALWLGIGIGFVVVVIVMLVIARRIDRIEDDSSYVQEEQGGFTPYGQKYLDLLLFRKNDD